MPQEGAGPGRLYVPSRRAAPGSEEIELELRRLADGRLAMLAFSRLDLLVAGCGESQPWVLVPQERLPAARAAAGVDIVLLDVALPAQLRHDGGPR